MNVLIEKLPTEIQVWKKAVDDILRADDYHKETNFKLRKGEKTIFRKLINFSRFQDFKPDLAKSLTDELKNHEKYHSPKCEVLGTFRRICIQYYIKDQNAYRTFKMALLKDEDGWLSAKLEQRRSVGSYDFYFSDEFENVTENYELDDESICQEESIWQELEEETNKLLSNVEIELIKSYCQSKNVKYYRDNWTEDIKWINQNLGNIDFFLRYCTVEFYCCFKTFFSEKTGFILLTPETEFPLHFMICLNEGRKIPYLIVFPYEGISYEMFKNPFLDTIKPLPYDVINSTKYLNKKTEDVFSYVAKILKSKIGLRDMFQEKLNELTMEEAERIGLI